MLVVVKSGHVQLQTASGEFNLKPAVEVSFVKVNKINLTEKSCRVFKLKRLIERSQAELANEGVVLRKLNKG